MDLEEEIQNSANRTKLDGEAGGSLLSSASPVSRHKRPQFARQAKVAGKESDDHLALEPVLQYAGRIRTFLGLEDGDEISSGAHHELGGVGNGPPGGDEVGNDSDSALKNNDNDPIQNSDDCAINQHSSPIPIIERPTLDESSILKATNSDADVPNGGEGTSENIYIDVLGNFHQAGVRPELTSDCDSPLAATDLEQNTRDGKENSAGSPDDCLQEQRLLLSDALGNIYADKHQSEMEPGMCRRQNAGIDDNCQDDACDKISQGVTLNDARTILKDEQLPENLTGVESGACPTKDSPSRENGEFVPDSMMDSTIKDQTCRDNSKSLDDFTGQGVTLNDATTILKDEQLPENLTGVASRPCPKEDRTNKKNGEFAPDCLVDSTIKAETSRDDSKSLDELTGEKNFSFIDDDEDVLPPNLQNLRRLSVDIVNKVLFSAGDQLRRMSKDARGTEGGGTTNGLVDDPTVDEERNNNWSKSHTNSHAEGPGRVSDAGLTDIPLKTLVGDSRRFSEDSEYPDDEDTICGIGSFRPKWLQPWATDKTYVLMYAIIGVLQGSYYGYLIGTISTLEKRFAFKSKVSGIIMMVDELTPLLLGVFVGYFGGKLHRPRFVGFGMLLNSLCCIVSAMPYFIYGPATHLTGVGASGNATGPELCDGDPLRDQCGLDDRPPTLAAVLFLALGSFLKGFGNLAYYAVGLAYMDDNVKKHNTPLYMAFVFAFRLSGPLIGFIMSSAFLKIPENPFENPDFDPDDARWIGGWWMGFMVQGILLLFLCIPISLFPRRLPGTKRMERKREKFSINISGLVRALKRLGENPMYVFMTCNTVLAVFGIFGHYIMLPKYLEHSFHLPSADASLLAGVPQISSSMVSILIGGFLIHKFKPSARVLTAATVGLEVFFAASLLLLMLPGCKQVQLANYGQNRDGLILRGACNDQCNCTTAAYNPYCAPDQETVYFSPCHAGCTRAINGTLLDCACASSDEEWSFTEGICEDEDCWGQALIYVIALPIITSIVNVLRVAHTMLLLRCIRPEDKSVALGVFEAILSTLGFIPFPVVYGALVDSTCLVWEQSCGGTGNCWFYDVSRFRLLLHTASAAFLLLASFCMAGVCFFSRRVRDLYTEDELSDAGTF